MTKNQRFAALCLLVVLMAASSFAQERPMVGTVVDIDEGRNRLQIEMDDAAYTRITVETDAISTTYHGFGTMIAGKPEIFTGSRGLSNVRMGDRVEVRGPVRSEGVYRGNQITLLGRSIPASPTGVGETRNPATSGNTPMDDRVTGATDTGSRVEGTVRQINEREGRIVIQTPDRQMITVRTARNTPVYYRGEVYRVSNLELGDRIRIEADRDYTTNEVTARRIDVAVSVQESGTAAGTAGNVTVLAGRVTRTEAGLDYVYVDSGRGEVRVDMRQAEDARGEIIRARDLRAGDMVEISGSYNRVGDMFLASTLRFTSGSGADEPLDDREGEAIRFGLVTINGTVTETLENGATIGFRDRDSTRVLRIWMAEDLIVRTKANTYTTAETLKLNDTAVIEAFRDLSGNLVAQTVRLTNR